MLLCIVLLIYYTCDVNICVEIDPGTHMLCTRLCPLETSDIQKNVDQKVDLRSVDEGKGCGPLDAKSGDI
jgi:hypothetical protein